MGARFISPTGPYPLKGISRSFGLLILSINSLKEGKREQTANCNRREKTTAMFWITLVGIANDNLWDMRSSVILTIVALERG